MRKILTFTLLLTTAVSARAASNRSDWSRVQAIPTGTKVHIKTLGHGSARCLVASVDADSIQCGGITFQRDTILYIKSSHRLRSTLVGIAAGYGTALAVTAAYAEKCNLNCKNGTVGAVAVFDLGAIVAVPITFGVLDLTAGTIYHAP